jgi:hypothetical protein
MRGKVIGTDPGKAGAELPERRAYGVVNKSLVQRGDPFVFSVGQENCGAVSGSSDGV